MIKPLIAYILGIFVGLILYKAINLAYILVIFVVLIIYKSINKK
jgi:hypothetical protein